MQLEHNLPTATELTAYIIPYEPACRMPAQF